MIRLRIKYRKIGAIRYASHRDLMRIFRRAFATAGVPVCYSQGFNPHPRLSFGPSLRTGWESHGEYMDVMLDTFPRAIRETCNPHLPEGLEIIEAAIVGKAAPKLSADISAARYSVTIHGDNFIRGEGDNRTKDEKADSNTLAGEIAPSLESDIQKHFSISGEASDESGLLDVKVYEDDGDVRIDYLSTMRGGKSLFPEELLQPLVGHARDFPVPPKVVREELYVKRGSAYVSPISKGVVQKLL